MMKTPSEDAFAKTSVAGRMKKLSEDE